MRRERFLNPAYSSLGKPGVACRDTLARLLPAPFTVPKPSLSLQEVFMVPMHVLPGGGSSGAAICQVRHLLEHEDGGMMGLIRVEP